MRALRFGIVFDRRYLGRNSVLIPFEIDDPKTALVPAAAPPHRDLALVVPTADPLLADGQALQRLDVGQSLASLHLAESGSR